MDKGLGALVYTKVHIIAVSAYGLKTLDFMKFLDIISFHTVE